MLTRRFLAIGLLGAFVTGVRAQAPLGPAIDLRVEQPVVAGLPVWLHVIVHDVCLENWGPSAPAFKAWSRQDWEERDLAFAYPWLRQDGATVTRDGKAAARAAFQIDTAQEDLKRPAEACPGSAAPGQPVDHRIALHGAYDLNVPGSYAVQWRTESNNGTIVARSAWLNFTVEPSTAAARAAWLHDALSNRPTDRAGLVADYIPTLLAAWRDPAVTRSLLNLACGEDNLVGEAAADALAYNFTPDDITYLAARIAAGCVTDAMPAVLRRHAAEIGKARGAIMRAFVSPPASILRERFFTAHPHGPAWNLATPIRALGALRHPGNGDEVDAWADAYVADTAKSEFPIVGGRGAQDIEQAFLVYFHGRQLTPVARSVVQSMALDENGAGGNHAAALAEIAESADPANTAWLIDLLSAPAESQPPFYGRNDVEWVAGDAAIRAAPFLRAVMAHAGDWGMRDMAAIELQSLGEADGGKAIEGTLRTAGAVERDFIQDATNRIQPRRAVTDAEAPSAGYLYFLPPPLRPMVPPIAASVAILALIAICIDLLFRRNRKHRRMGERSVTHHSQGDG